MPGECALIGASRVLLTQEVHTYATGPVREKLSTRAQWRRTHRSPALGKTATDSASDPDPIAGAAERRRPSRRPGRASVAEPSECGSVAPRQPLRDGWTIAASGTSPGAVPMRVDAADPMGPRSGQLSSVHESL